MPLTPTEIELVRDLGFDLAIAERIREHSRTPLEPLEPLSPGDVTPDSGLSVAVADGDEAEQLMNALRPVLDGSGYRTFWSMRRQPNGLQFGDEVALLRTTDPYAMIRFCQTDGGNYDIDTADILDRLEAWKEICAFEVVGADSDWVAIQFTRLPEKICAFAAEVFEFCPDSVGQGVGLKRERDNPQQFQDARALCPEVNVKDRTAELLKTLPPQQAEQMQRLMAAAAASGNDTSTEMGVRLLALELKRTKYLFLWWD